MRQKRLAEFDRLIGSYYGQSGLDTDPRKRVQDLLSTYYGNPAAARRRRSSSPSVSLSLGCDDGEVLSQSAQARARSTNGQGAGQAASLDFEEYVIDICDAAPPAPPRAGASGQPELLAPRTPQTQPDPPEPRSAQTQPPPPAAPASPGAAAGSSASLSAAEADIVSDIQSIIRGQKVYDKDRGLVDRSTAASTDSGGRNAPYAGTSGQPGNGHAIFESIARSMQYANAYDLGSVELENRFAEFDRQEDQRRAGPRKNGGPATPSTPAAESQAPATSASGPTDLADFMADLDTIKSKPAPQEVSRPFYDAGEHVLAGNGLYADMLRVGKGQAVRLSYGHIIAMGDLYDTVDDLINADPAELNRLKTLVVRSTAYYEGKRSNAALDVSNKQWDDETQGRYLKLAEGNYEHFSPPTVAMGSGLKTTHGDNRVQWERYHRRAIEDAQQEYLAHSGKGSIFFERALIINAFGDHFLTDAFAAGHLINKDMMIGRFKSAFYNGSDLAGAAEKFFDRVAATAWTGDLAAKFSKLETVDYPAVHVPWYIALVPGGVPLAGRDVPVPFHPNIDSASRFASLLKEAARQQPERIGNLIVKALHDYLNEHGIEVTNRAGDGTWMLPGDGTLMIGAGKLTPGNLAKNLAIIRKAVQQSIDDINSPTIRASNLNFQTLFDGVWRYVPQLTSASQQQMAALIRDYTDPNSSTLAGAAAAIVTAQLNSFIKLLLEEHKLQPA
jgi:hypothetical protein